MAAALLWACSGIAGKYLFLGGLRPAELVQARVTIAALLLGVVLVAGRRSLLKISRADVLPLFVLGGVITAILQMAYFLAIQYIQVALAVLIQYLAPLLVAGFSMLFLKERCSLMKIAALVCSLAGCYLAVGGLGLAVAGLNPWGIFWGLCAAVFYAAYTLYSERQLHSFSPWTVLFYSLFFASLSLNVVFGPLIFMERAHALRDWSLIVFVAICGTLIPYGLFYLGINHIRATRAIITATLEPIFAALLAFLLIAERLAPLQLAGGALVIAAIVLLQLQREQGESAVAAVKPRLAADSKNSLIGTLE